MRRRLMIAAAICVIWWIAAPFLARFLIIERPLPKADAIIVLSGSAAYKERTKKAAQLYAQGISSTIFITNDGQNAGWSDADQANPSFTELERRELIVNGVDAEAITVLPGYVAGTDDEAKVMAKQIGASPIDSLLIITSGYHTRRALWTFEKILADKHLEIGIVSPPPGEQTLPPTYWWVLPSGWQMVAGEYVKSAVYYFYY